MHTQHLLNVNKLLYIFKKISHCVRFHSKPCVNHPFVYLQALTLATGDPNRTYSYNNYKYLQKNIYPFAFQENAWGFTEL